MISRRDWQIAFLKRARSDWEAYQRTHEQMWPTCHRLHFLQMATEKLGKALLVGGETALEEITHTHSALVKFMRIVGKNHRLPLNMGMTKSQLQAHINRLLPIAHEIERLAPALARDGPNPEYPWLSPLEKIHVPVEYSFPLANMLQTPHGIKVLKYVETCIVEFERLFFRK